MKTIGLLGGTSWISTIEYYRIINQQINIHLGGVASARILLYSSNFEEVRPPKDVLEWKKIEEHYVITANKLEAAGADCLLLCSNTHHFLADAVHSSIKIPLLHVGSALVAEIDKLRLKKVGLLGTLSTMDQPFIKRKLLEHGLDIVLPAQEEKEFIHDSIFNEFGKGIFSPTTKDKYLFIISRLIQQGAQGIIFGSTELPVLIQPEEVSVPVINTTFIHARSAVEFALNK